MAELAEKSRDLAGMAKLLEGAAKACSAPVCVFPTDSLNPKKEIPAGSRARGCGFCLGGEVFGGEENGGRGGVGFG